MKQTVVPSGTRKGSRDIVRVIYSILLFLFCCLILYLYFLLLHFGHEQRIQWFVVALVNVPVEAFYWQWLTADERQNDVNNDVTDDGTMQYGKPDRTWKAKFSL